MNNEVRMHEMRWETIVDEKKETLWVGVSNFYFDGTIDRLSVNA
jgi:hypothetical protein